MTLALPRSLPTLAKERAQLAKKAGCQYRTEVRSCDYFDVKFHIGKGFKPVVLWGDEDEPAWTGPIYTKAKDRKLAAYHADIAADTLRRYYLMHDHRRHEIEQREAAAAKRAEERRIMDLRKAFTNDRLQFFDALAMLLTAVDECAGPPPSELKANALDWAKRDVKRLLDQHREGAEALRKVYSPSEANPAPSGVSA